MPLGLLAAAIDVLLTRPVPVHLRCIVRICIWPTSIHICTSTSIYNLYSHLLLFVPYS